METKKMLDKNGLEYYTGKIKQQIPKKTSDLTNDSGFIDGLVILSYGNSTWNDFITAYQKNKVVYCRASSNSNPATGSQTRLAFMAYVNNASSPTEVEFQYYRSVSSHTITQQGDQVFVYKLNKTNGWSVLTRETMANIDASGGLTRSYSGNKLTISGAGKQDTLVSGTNIKTINNESVLGSGNITIQGGGSPTWGSITGTLSNQTDLQNVLDSKMPITDITNSTVRVYELDTGLYRIMGTSTNPITVYWKSGGYSFEVNSTEYLLLTINENETVYHFLATRGIYFYEGYVNGPTSGFNKVLSDRDIKDVLTSTDTRSVLSANQGKILNESKQDTLVSGTNIKTINGDSILGSGDISITGGASNIENGTGTGSLKQAGNNTASGEYSFASGTQTTASSYGSHTEGAYTTASGFYSHAEGYYTTASGQGAHAEGAHTTAKGQVQHVSGQYNVIDNASKYIEIVGNGTPSANSNAYTLDWYGNGVYSGKLTVGTDPTANMDVATKQYVDTQTSSIVVPTKTSDLTNDSGFITSYTETDPVFNASAAKNITSTDITNWNNKSNFSGSYNDLTNKPTIPVVPTNISSFINDSNYQSATQVQTAINNAIGTALGGSY